MRLARWIEVYLLFLIYVKASMALCVYARGIIALSSFVFICRPKASLNSSSLSSPSRHLFLALPLSISVPLSCQARGQTLLLQLLQRVAKFMFVLLLFIFNSTVEKA